MVKCLRALMPCFLMLFAVQIVYGQGSLLVTPRRIVFEGNKRTAEINLANIGKDSARYVISMVEMRMKDDGTFETITEPELGEHFASKNLRFFPRSVYLGPNEPQVIKVQLHNAGSLQPGEYRSHIYFRAVPEEKPLGEEAQNAEAGTISVKLTPVFGITIPVIIRIGANNAKIDFSDLKFITINDTLPRLNLVIKRIGNMSVYGDLVVDHISNDGKTNRVFTAKGLAVYAPNKLRKMNLNLEVKRNIDFKKGSLKITYVSQEQNGEKFAETIFKLGE